MNQKELYCEIGKHVKFKKTVFTKFKETEFTNIRNSVHRGEKDSQNPVTRVKTLINIVKFYNSEQHFDSSQ
jgi:hypothetical protein